MTSPAAARLPINGGHQIVVKYDLGGQDAVTVLGAFVTSGDFMLNSDAQAILNAWWASVRVFMPNSVICQGGSYRETVANGLAGELVAPPNPAGANASASLLAPYSAIIRWKTNQGGRSGKGRTFVPGINSSTVDAKGRTLTPAHQTAVSNAANAYLTNAVFSTTIRPCVLSFRTGQAHAITGYTVPSVAGIQRRRMR